MLKILKRIVIAAIIIKLVAIISNVLIFTYKTQYKQKEIYQESSPDNNHTVSFYQVGEPQWSFGSVDAKLVLYNSDGKKLDEESFELSNDGANVIAGNIVEIIWSEDQVEIKMKEFDTTQQYTYILKYSE